MASSEVELVNLALTELGQGLISSLDDAVKSATLAKLNYPQIRKAVLRAYPWNCAMKRGILASDAVAPISQWSYKFQLPADCLTVRLVNDELETEYAVEGRFLLYNGTAPIVRYTYDISDTTQFDALLEDAIVARLAHRLALPLTQSTALKDSMWENYRAKIREARSVDAQEGSLQRMLASDWTDAHDGYGVGNVQSLRNPA